MAPGEPAKMFSESSKGWDRRRAAFTLLGASRFPSLADLASPEGRSKTRKDDWGRFSTSSKAFPDDLRRTKPLGSLIGIMKR